MVVGGGSVPSREIVREYNVDPEFLQMGHQFLPFWIVPKPDAPWTLTYHLNQWPMHRIRQKACEVVDGRRGFQHSHGENKTMFFFDDDSGPEVEFRQKVGLPNVIDLWKAPQAALHKCRSFAKFEHMHIPRVCSRIGMD